MVSGVSSALYRYAPFLRIPAIPDIKEWTRLAV